MDRLVYSVEEAAERLGLSRPSAYLAVKRGQIPCIRIGRRLLIPISALEILLANAGSEKDLSIARDDDEEI
ncbi:helix-turn-helix domain-containing protein [Bacteroidota bacterium]